MSIIQKAMYRGVPGGTAYTVPTNTSAVITNIVVANSSSTAKNVTVSVVSGAATSPIISNSPVNGNDTIVLDIRQVMAADDQITVAGDAGIYVHVSGVEIQS